MSFLENLNWRYAVKTFDRAKKVSEEDLQKIRNAIRLAPSSLGVQMYKVIQVVDGKTREKMKAASSNQSQVVDAAALFVFCERIDTEHRMESMFKSMSKGDEEFRKRELGEYESMVRGVMKQHEKKMDRWSQKMAGIALGFGLAACAELKIDSCPMDSFETAAVAEILKLSADFTPIAYLAVGYRSADDSAAKRPKWRFPEEEIFEKIEFEKIEYAKPL